MPFDKNPFTSNTNDPTDKREKISIRNLPISVDNKTILDFLKSFPQLKLTSPMMYANERTSEGRLTSYLNGDRYVYAVYPVVPILPNNVKIGGFQAKIHHASQRNNCKRCGQVGHDPRNDACPAYVEEQDVVCFKGHTHVLSNMYPCEVIMEDQVFASAEHAYQWYKATDLGFFDLAERIYNAEHAGKAKAMAKEIPKEISQDWCINHGMTLMTDVIWAKLYSCQEFYETLLSTRDSMIVEATPDKYWGCGLLPQQANHTLPAYWPGQNRLGIIMAEIRSEELAYMRTSAQSDPDSTYGDEWNGQYDDDEATVAADSTQAAEIDGTHPSETPTDKKSATPDEQVVVREEQQCDSNENDKTISITDESVETIKRTKPVNVEEGKQRRFIARKKKPRLNKDGTMLSYVISKKRHASTSPVMENPVKTKRQNIANPAMNLILPVGDVRYIPCLSIGCVTEPFIW